MTTIFGALSEFAFMPLLGQGLVLGLAVWEYQYSSGLPLIRVFKHSPNSTGMAAVRGVTLALLNYVQGLMFTGHTCRSPKTS